MSKKILLAIAALCLIVGVMTVTAFAAEPGTGHDITYVPAVDSGCHQDGCMEYWYCEGCDVVYADEACTIITNRKNLTIPATGKEEIPQTGDVSVVVLAVIALASMACVVVLNKKKVA